MTKKLLILLACAGMAGCMPHFKDWDSYQTLFRNGETTPPERGDPYTFGGIAGGSGGKFARQSYATDNNAPDFRDATDSGKLGEIGTDRTPTPDGPVLMRDDGMPLNDVQKPASEGLSKTAVGTDVSAKEGRPELQLIEPKPVR